MAPNQSGFTHTDGGNPCQHTNMAGDTEAPGVCKTLPVTEQEIWPNGKSAQCLQHGWYLAK